MKKSIILLAFIFSGHILSAQTFFRTFTGFLAPPSDVTHYGSLVIGDLNPGYISNPWLSYNDVLLKIDNQDKNVSLVVANDYGRLNLNVASFAGAYSPISTQGDIVITKNTGEHMIFNLNNSNNDGTSSFVFGDSVNSRTMTIFNNGKVAVGSNSVPTDFMFAVGGKAIAEEVHVKLQSNWPDYVFNSDYELASLQDVEQHIKEKGHLKNIPPAKEAEEKGISLGEMNKRLLEKIEELTLYTIQQQKLIEKMQEDIKELKKNK